MIILKVKKKNIKIVFLRKVKLVNFLKLTSTKDAKNINRIKQISGYNNIIEVISIKI